MKKPKEPLAVLMRVNDVAVGGAVFVRYLYTPAEARPAHYNTRTTGLFVKSVADYERWHKEVIEPYYNQTLET